MAQRWNDIRQLAALIEAESLGRDFDRRRASALADELAERHPEISGSLGLIRERMAGGSSHMGA